MTVHELSSEIRRLAMSVGFDKVGFARADVVASRHLLYSWLGRGYHADMAWMEKNPATRSDPREWYPEAVSVVSVGLNYYTQDSVPNDPAIGKISRYAWGDDYHDIMTSKLRALLSAVKEIDDRVDGRVACDTSPLMDKYWAVQAGIGWQGKHSNVLTRDLGSWLFLGELVLNAELEYDRPIDDFCGSCTICIDACPTGAITEPYVVDAGKCLSYWTIESKGDEIPNFIAEHAEGWIFGCDICQDVCPWNEKFSRPTDDKPFQPRADNVQLPLHAWATMSDDEFRRRFKKSPVRRAKPKGMKRNARAIGRRQDVP